MSDRPAPLRKTGHPRAVAARERKRADAEALGIDAAFISEFVESFYSRIRDDAMLGPIFAARILDWPTHLGRMKQFWRSILHNSGEFTGNPMQQHLALHELNKAHFSRWLTLFYTTLRELEGNPAATQEVGARARMIADSLLTGIAMRHQGIAGARAGATLPHP